MKSKVILFLSIIGVTSSCTKETAVDSGSSISGSNVLLLFKINDLDSNSAWNSYNEYLSDSSQRPHQPVIEWENGEVMNLNYQYLVFESTPDLAGSYFSYQGDQIFRRVFNFSQDSTATGVINWNHNQSDTISITKLKPTALGRIQSADFISLNGDTVYDRSKIVTEPKYLSFYQQPIIFVKIKTSFN